MFKKIALTLVIIMSFQQATAVIEQPNVDVVKWVYYALIFAVRKAIGA